MTATLIAGASDDDAAAAAASEAAFSAAADEAAAASELARASAADEAEARSEAASLVTALEALLADAGADELLPQALSNRLAASSTGMPAISRIFMVGIPLRFATSATARNRTVPRNAGQQCTLG